MSRPLHVIVGAGQIGPLLAERLLARGHRVRLVRRGAFPHDTAGAETVRADVADPADAARALAGAAVVYHCANPRYHRWAQELLPLTRGIVRGTRAAGARLVALDNLYMYTLGPDGRLAEDTPTEPRTKKGLLRMEAAEAMLAADRAGDVQVAIGRAADFVGPTIANSIFGPRFWRRLAAGRPVEVLGDPNAPHSYTFAPDVADALLTLGLDSDARGVWHLPTLPAVSTRTWVEAFARALDRPARTRRLTPFALRLIGLVVPEARELPEMIYQWEGPFRLDDTRFRTRYGATPTPYEEVVAATLRGALANGHLPHSTRLVANATI